MPILPIDTGRYGTPEMLRVFEEKARVQRLLDVEAALALAHAEVGNIPRKDAEKIAAMASLLERSLLISLLPTEKKRGLPMIFRYP